MAEPGIEEVRRALAEDRAHDDATTRLLGSAARSHSRATLRAEGECVVAGLAVAGLVFREIEPSVAIEPHVEDGTRVHAGDVLATVRGPAHALLAAERVALNFLQHLTGVATATRRAVDAVAGTGTRITHTRKTTPGLRSLEIAAVVAGGGVANRASLADAAMWKDNHWAMLESRSRTLRDVLAAAPPGLPLIVEVETEAQLDEALAAGATHLLLDNRPPAVVADWAKRAGEGVTIQASGGITPETAADYARAGAHLISIGSLTHSVVAAPISMELLLAAD